MKNLRNLPIFACVFLLVLIPMRAEAVPPPSPAGGNYLVLDGVDDHAILDFETFGLLMPKGTDEWTFEAWIYPTTPPDENIHAVVLSQQVKMNIVNPHHDGFLKLSSEAYLDVGGENPPNAIIALAIRGLGMIVEFPLNQWHHIAFQTEEKQTTLIVNELMRVSLGGMTLAPDISHAKHPQNFTIGGFGEEIEFWNGNFWGHFAGYIDEVRVSRVVRYDITKWDFTPQTKFKNDAKTVALWHFDESRGTRDFLDVSGNAYHLVGKNGAMTDGTLAVEAEGKLAITWGRLKQ